MKKWHKHFGIYGIAVEGKRVLVINKTKGPYTGRYDLPGGGIKEDESLIENLKREFIEETGYEIEVFESLGTYDFLIDESYKEFDKIHHIAITYRVRIGSIVGEVEEKVEVYGNEEKNDSSGIEWVDIERVNESNSSPLLLQAIKDKGTDLKEMSLYP